MECKSSFYKLYLIDMEGPVHGVSAHWRSVAEPQAGARLRPIQLTFQCSTMVLTFPIVSILDRRLVIVIAVRSPFFSLLELNISPKPNSR